MSAQFIEIAANTVIIDFFGLAINVGKDYMQDGYIAVDFQGTVYVFTVEPITQSDLWTVPHDSDAKYEQVLDLSTIEYVPSIYEWYQSSWRHLCFPLSDFPVLRTA